MWRVLRGLLVVVGAYLVGRAVLDGEWLLLGSAAAVGLLALAYEVWHAKRQIRAEDEEADRLAREGTGADFTTPSGSGG